MWSRQHGIIRVLPMAIWPPLYKTKFKHRSSAISGICLPFDKCETHQIIETEIYKGQCHSDKFLHEEIIRTRRESVSESLGHKNVPLGGIFRSLQTLRHGN